MTRLRTTALVLVIIPIAIAGCAVGNFITGAPSRKSIAAANGLLARRCANCHEIPDPSAMSASAWQSSLDFMKLRMQLPQSEWDSLAAMGGSEAQR